MIRAMEPDLVAQIKAGEVIERPASVVKELLENALDAGARRIRIEIGEGGTRIIRVVDDGNGIPPGELALAFGEHTTSKLQSTDDLDHVTTLGFRGEALYAISNVARVEAVSGTRDAPEAASVTFDHGVLVDSEPAAPGGGTRMAVFDLFAKVPARRKHLKTPRSESAAVHQIVAQYVVAHPGVSITLVTDGRMTLSSPGTGSMAEAFGSIYGADLVDKMIPVEYSDGIELRGLISPPSVTRPNRTGILIFVNGRPVRSAALTFAIEDAYSGLLMVGRHPLAAVSISLPPEEVDPNVHPTKLEVRFMADRHVFAAARALTTRGLAAEHRIVEAAAEVMESFPAENQTMLTIPEPERRPYPEGITFESPAEPHQAPPVSFRDSLPSLRVFGQAARTFIVAEGPTGLYMIDQHAAHERILFDTLTENRDGVLRQPLLEPARVELSPEGWALLEAHPEQVAALGFEVEPFGDRWCLVRTVPIAAGRTVEPEVLVEVVEALCQARAAEDVVHRALTVVACHAAVRAGQALSMSEMRELVSALERTPNPRTCPHGRPTTIHLSTERLEKEFGRR